MTPIEPTLVPIPAGPFQIGTSNAQAQLLAAQFPMARKWLAESRFSREQPAHVVDLAAFAIGKYPVTVGEYRRFVMSGGYAKPDFWTTAGSAWRKSLDRTQPDYWDDAPWTGDERLPVVGVSWYEAVAYCRWLSGFTGRNYRLPTEAEWEYAARGHDGRHFPWGNAFDVSHCNMRESHLGHTTPVGHYSPAGDSPFGCADIVGNVSEWTANRFAPYPSADDGRDDLEGDGERTTRGGSWHSHIMRARTTSRGINDSFFTDNDLGFRVACGGVR